MMRSPESLLSKSLLSKPLSPRPPSLRSLFLPSAATAAVALLAAAPAAAEPVKSPPKVVLISLDGAKPDRIQEFLASGVLPANGGLARLARRGVVARRNITATPSLTAVSHIAIATGSTAVNNDIPANSFHPVAASIATGMSGFAAPIGGYHLSPLGPSDEPTAEPLWVRLRKAGKTVVTATWPGADGADIMIGDVRVQAPKPTRVTDYAVPFGTFGGLGAAGFSLTAEDFAPNAEIGQAIRAAGYRSFSPILVTTAPFETVSCASTTAASCATGDGLDLDFAMHAAALDGTDDDTVNYDSLVVFDARNGVDAGPFSPPATGPAHLEPRGQSAKFFFRGSGNRVGTAYFLGRLEPNLSKVRLARYSAYYIPRNAPVLAAVDDINEHVGFWAPQPDYRIPERLSPGFDGFPDRELEAMYQDQVRSFVAYQADVAERAIRRNPGADLVMIYIEEPDGSGHQFTLTDRRQATDPRDPTTIGERQDRDKVARYAEYVRNAYREADRAVARILDLVGPDTDVIVVSDHGMAPFHTAVSLSTLLRNAGIDTTKMAVRTSGSAANIYVDLAGREDGGTVARSAFQGLVDDVYRVLREARDRNDTFNASLDQGRVFDIVVRRPANCSEGPGRCTNRQIGQDFGDVFAVLAEGYNFDGIQSPVVARRGDRPASDATVFSVPNFYGAHGYDPALLSMSASFLAAGPSFRRGATVGQVSNIDVAPTIMRILGVCPAATVDGKVLVEALR